MGFWELLLTIIGLIIALYLIGWGLVILFVIVGLWSIGEDDNKKELPKPERNLYDDIIR